MHNHPRQSRLRIMKRRATALLVGVAVLYVWAVALEARFPWLAYVAAAAEAGIVGALADWFAVVALFHHPFNLRFIPHTRILPRNKERIASQLAAFIQREFLAPEVVVTRLRAVDPAGRITAWLVRPGHVERIVRYTSELLGYGLRALEDLRVRSFLQEAAGKSLRDLELAPILASVLDALTQDRRHHVLLEAALAKADDVLADEQTRIFIGQELARHFWVMWLSERLNLHLTDAAARKLVDVLARIVSEIRNDPDHELRRRFDAATAAFIDRLRNDAALRERVENAKQEALQGGALQNYLGALWNELRDWALVDIGKEGSVITGRLCSALRFMAGRLHADRAMQQWINEQLFNEAPALILRYRAPIGQFVEEQVNSWTTDKLVREIESAIGPDLQFIRINGTVVGAAAGLVIYLLTQLFTR